MASMKCAKPSASLRTGPQEKRGGNGTPWKAGKTPRASFPLFPPRLEIRQATPDSHIPTAPAASFRSKRKDKK
jgi:hypothetical protein